MCHEQSAFPTNMVMIEHFDCQKCQLKKGPICQICGLNDKIEKFNSLLYNTKVVEKDNKQKKNQKYKDCKTILKTSLE